MVSAWNVTRTIHWVLVGVRTASAPLKPSSAPTRASIDTNLALFVRRWQIEVTFAETRAHLGAETQRQWSDKAIARTTPALLGLYSLITLWASNLVAQTTKPYRAAWHRKKTFSFVDAIGAVRLALWVGDLYGTSPHARDMREIPPDRLARMAEALCFVA